MTVLQVEQHVRDSAVVVAVAGDIDSTSVDALATHLDAALKAASELPGRVLVVDLGAVTYFGSAGLNAIVGCYQNGLSGDVAVRVVASTAEVIRPLQVTQLDEVVPPYPTVPDALADIRDDDRE
ncbi:STAS domain-containing protein [Mycobacterium sp. MMS18-G62]